MSICYVVNAGDKSVSVVDTIQKATIKTIPDVAGQGGIVVTPDGKFVYVVGPYGTNTVSVIDTATNELIQTIAVGENSYSIIVTPNGKTVYVMNGYSSVSAIDTESNSVIATILLPSNNYGDILMAVSSDSKYLYIPTSEGIMVIDTNTNIQTTTLNLFVKNFITYPTTKILYAGASYKIEGPISHVNGFFGIDTITNQIPAGIEDSSIIGCPYGIAATPDERYVYVSVYNGISVFDTQYVEQAGVINIETTIKMPVSPDYLCIPPDGKYLYALDSNRKHVYIIDISSNTVITIIDLSGYGLSNISSLTYTATPPYDVYVGVSGGQNIFVIDTSFEVSTITAGPSPNRMAMKPV